VRRCACRNGAADPLKRRGAIKALAFDLPARALWLGTAAWASSCSNVDTRSRREFVSGFDGARRR
jgi:hypothetical protein